MIGATAIWAVSISVLISTAAAIKCLSCTESVRPRDCEYVQECGSHEKCSIESYLTTTGYVRYNVGCMDIFKCAAVGRKRAVLNATVLQEIQEKDDFATIPEEQWDQSQRDMLLCAECCETELCNVKGCGEQGLPPSSGPICYGCDQARDPDSCNRIRICDRDYACSLSTTRIGMDFVYTSECIHTQECNQHRIPNMFGRRRGVDMTSRLERVALCNKCCTSNLCNSGYCSSLTHLPITSTTNVQAATTLPTVGCLYKGQTYNEGQRWQDGCDYLCTCVSGTTGLYNCYFPCPTWELPSVCYFQAPAPGKCCAKPICPDYILIHYPVGYQEL